MAAKYTMQEMKDLHREGETLLYPRMVLSGSCSTEKLAQAIASGSTFSQGEVQGIIQQLGRQLAREMAEGKSVKIDGIGLFTPSLALRKDKERESPDGTGTRRNAESIMVGKVNFRPDRKLIAGINTQCRLERSPKPYTCHTSAYSAEERLAIALTHLEEKPFLSVTEYAALTGLGRTAAVKELRQWGQDPESGIRAT